MADSDFDIVLQKTEACTLLLLTDYTCMEMYAFKPRTVGKYLRLNLRTFPKHGAQVIDEISGSLEQLFVVRLVNFVLSLQLTAVNWEKSLRLLNGRVELDLDDYLTRYLNKNGRTKDRNRVLAEYELRTMQLSPDPRNQIHGHDFLELVSWYLRRTMGFRRRLTQRPSSANCMHA